MGREVRMVSADWEHPTDARGGFIPLHEGYTERVTNWDLHAAKWADGLRDDYNGGWKPLEGSEIFMAFSGWDGERPKKEDYMPEWSKEEATYLMMYETVTEGTPISPPFITPEELATWLAANDASAFGSQTATYEEWLSTCKRGWAPSAIMSAKTGFVSGVSGLVND